MIVQIMIVILIGNINLGIRYKGWCYQNVPKMMNFFLEVPVLVQMSRSILKYEEILTRENSVLGRFLRHASIFFWL